jgi:DNA-binding response OmpR family regulator
MRKLQLQDDTIKIDLANPIQINGIPIRGLTSSESELLRVLAENRGQIVSTATIAKSLWKDEAAQKFSVYYFPKLVFTLRNKLAAVGVQPEFIKSQSGAGYYIE